MAEHHAIKLLHELKALLHARIEKPLDERAKRRYQELRKSILDDGLVGPVAPKFLRDARDLDDFFPYIRTVVPQSVWADRRAHVNVELGPAFDAAEKGGSSAADDDIVDALSEFNADRVKLAWDRAVARREADPPAALTAARTLLETVCKHVLDRVGVKYGRKDSLGDLYTAAARAVGVHASQAAGQLKEFLGACGNVATKIGEVRNEHGDSHGVGEGAPDEIAPMYGALVVNLAGALAGFLVAALQESLGNKA
jgi:hypothetical protein